MLNCLVYVWFSNEYSFENDRKDDWNKAIDSNYHEQTLLVSLGDKKQITLDVLDLSS